MLRRHLSSTTGRRERGLTLVELVVAMALLVILLFVATPDFSAWINNTRVRSVAEGMQNGVRLAQAEAVRRNRTVAFFLTNAEPAIDAVPVANGVNWGIRTTTLFADDVAEFVRGAAAAEVGTGVAIVGPAAICFNAAGQQVTVAAEGCAAAVTNYDVTRAVADRRLRIVVSMGGRVRMCDPDKVLSDANPDGC